MKRKILLFTGVLAILSLFFAGNVAFAQKNITGIVTDDTGGTLPGASVIVKGTTIGVMTSTDGSYTISVPEGSTSLVFSYIGFLNQEIAIDGDVVNCQLALDQTGIEEVIVVGYGQM